jgi:hypothetical protein
MNGRCSRSRPPQAARLQRCVRDLLLRLTTTTSRGLAVLVEPSSHRLSAESRAKHIDVSHLKGDGRNQNLPVAVTGPFRFRSCFYNRSFFTTVQCTMWYYIQSVYDKPDLLDLANGLAGALADVRRKESHGKGSGYFNRVSSSTNRSCGSIDTDLKDL